MLYMSDDDEFAGDYFFKCPVCGKSTEICTTGGIPRPNDLVECIGCKTSLIITNREVLLHVSKKK